MIVVAHGNSLRAIVKSISGMTDKEILSFRFLTAIPMVLEFDSELNVLDKYFLYEAEEMSEVVERQMKEKIF